ncbi:MAG: mercuric reductase [Gemmataceae bacterium]
MTVQVLPVDTFNQQLVANVHPADWVNPTPAERYHLVVLGAGTAGLVTAAGAAGLGARVALIERELMGGDCLNVGCVPSKALLRAGRAVAHVRGGDMFGVRLGNGVHVDFPAVMERMRRLRASISPHDSAARFRALGVDVFLGAGRFTSPETIEVAGQTLRFARAVIATGGRALVPPIPGLDRIDYLTNANVFSLTELPRRLVVIGGGAIGCELAQAFARFGSHVTIVELLPRILAIEEPEASALVTQSLERDGVTIMVHTKAVRFAKDNGETIIEVERNGERSELHADAVLLSIGRVPNVEELNLEAAQVRFDKKQGVVVNDYLRTSNPRIFAAGDICSRYKFTHAADALARIVIQNALIFPTAKASALTIPWCTYTEPEVAHVGLYEQEARDKGIKIRTFTQPLNQVDRAILDGETEGYVKVLIGNRGDKILGATVVAAHAGDLIAELTLAMVNRIGLSKIARVIHPYPTQAEAIKKIGDAYNRTRLTLWARWLLRKWFAWKHG